MSDSSNSSPAKRVNRSKSEQKQSNNKLFITNLDGKADLRDLQNQLKSSFEKYGTVQSITVKRNRNSQYCFAFVDMKQASAAAKCVENCDRMNIDGKKIKVQFQVDNKRRKDNADNASIVVKWDILQDSVILAAMIGRETEVPEEDQDQDQKILIEKERENIEVEVEVTVVIVKEVDHLNQRRVPLIKHRKKKQIKRSSEKEQEKTFFGIVIGYRKKYLNQISEKGQ